MRGRHLGEPMTLSPELSNVVRRRVDTRVNCLKKVWAYIKNNNLRDPKNSHYFFPDKKLAKIFGNGRLCCRPITGMGKFLDAHLVGLSLDQHNNILHPHVPLPAEKARAWVNQCKYKCRVCSEEIDSKRKMQQHLEKHNLEYWEYCLTHGDPTVSHVMHQCRVCSVQFALSDKDAYYHLRKHGLGRIDYYFKYIMDENVNGK